jgi:hypothetical protein
VIVPLLDWWHARGQPRGLTAANPAAAQIAEIFPSVIVSTSMVRVCTITYRLTAPSPSGPRAP